MQSSNDDKTCTYVMSIFKVETSPWNVWKRTLNHWTVITAKSALYPSIGHSKVTFVQDYSIWTLTPFPTNTWTKPDPRQSGTYLMSCFHKRTLECDGCLQILGEPKENRELAAEITLRNPLPETLENCCFSIEGANLTAGQVISERLYKY